MGTNNSGYIRKEQLNSIQRLSNSNMSERQKRKKAKELEKASMTPKEPPSKLQKAVTHWLRKNVPTKKTKFLHAHVVEYFAASKAIDALLNDSPWARSKMDQDAID